MSAQDKNFDLDLVRKYPRAKTKIAVDVSPFGIKGPSADQPKVQTTFISPHGMEFQTPDVYDEGTLLKIQVALPNYWTRKQQFVEYQRIDTPDKFRILAKVVKSEDVGKRGKKKLVTVRTVNMDEVDEQVLKYFLQNG